MASVVRWSRLPVVLAMLALAGAPAAPAAPEAALAVDLYVATNGSDAWSGTLVQPNKAKTDGPFATLERARDAVRALKAGGPPRPATVWVRGGVYELRQTLKFGPEDSGTAGAPVAYRAYGREKPVLIGGRKVTNWQPYKGKILQADLGAQGFTDPRFRDLLFNGKRQPLARYPNFDPKNPYGGGWAYVDGTPVPMYTDIPGEGKRVLPYKEADARSWAHPEDGQVLIFARYNWFNNMVGIQSMDREKWTITLRNDCSYAIRPTDRYYISGLREELDAPGEWYLDRRTSTLYFWPPAPVEGGTVCAPTLRNLVEMGPGCAFVTLRGFTLECGEGAAVTLRDCSDCLIAGNTIRNVGDYNGHGVVVSGGFRNGVAGNDLYDIGRDAIVISGGDCVTLTPGDSYADNNYVHHPGTYYKWGCGVRLQGCGLRAAHNLIHDCPRAAMQFQGNNLVIEYNHVRHLCLESEDAAGIGTSGRDWISSRGSAVRYNLIHDVLGYGRQSGRWVSPFFAWGIYLDDNTGGVDVVGNIVYGCGRAGLHLHNARDTVVRNNVFADNTMCQIELSGWSVKHSNWARHFPTMVKGYESVIGQPAWQKMRGMQTHPKDAPLPSGLTMAGNVFEQNVFASRDPQAKLYRVNNVDFDHNQWDRNVLWQKGSAPLIDGVPGSSPEARWAEWQKHGEDVASLAADPKFVNVAKHDYRLRRDSPALPLGFQPIPAEKIGPYADPLRASWPVVEAEGAREHPLVAESPKARAATPPRNTVPHVAKKRSVTPALDGLLSPDEWPAEQMALKQSPTREPLAGAPCLARACHDGTTLHVAVTVPVADVGKVKIGQEWGQDDGAEVCFQDVSGARPGPVFVIHGFASGQAESVTDAGAPEDAAKRLSAAVRFAAKVQGSQWTGEWSIPLAAAGITYRPGLKLGFNIGVNRTQSGEWAIWVGALGATWRLDEAGYLVLE